MNGSRRVIGKASASSTQVILKNYSSTALDRVNITYAGSNTAYNIKLGSQAMTDYNNSVVYNSFSSTSDNQKWILQVEYNTDSNATNDRMNREIRLSNIDIVFPLDGSSFRITSGYGHRKYKVRNTIYDDFHYGFDIGINDTALKAPFDGTVVEIYGGSGYNGGLGRYIIIRSAENPDLYVHFFHLSSVDVAVNSTVTMNQVIGVTGGSGLSSGQHLHMTFSTNDTPGSPSKLDTYDPLWFYSNMVFERGAATDSIGDITQ